MGNDKRNKCVGMEIWMPKWDQMGWYETYGSTEGISAFSVQFFRHTLFPPQIELRITYLIDLLRRIDDLHI